MTRNLRPKPERQTTWRERAKEAYALKYDEEARGNRSKAAKLKALIKDVLGEIVEPEGDTIVLDGVTFRMIDYEIQGPQLVILRACKTCGKSTPSMWLTTITEVGEVLEETDVQCRPCEKEASLEQGEESATPGRAE